MVRTLMISIVPISLFTLLLSLRIIKCIVIVIVVTESVVAINAGQRIGREGKV